MLFIYKNYFRDSPNFLDPKTSRHNLPPLWLQPLHGRRPPSRPATASGGESGDAAWSSARRELVSLEAMAVYTLKLL